MGLASWYQAPWQYTQLGVEDLFFFPCGNLCFLPSSESWELRYRSQEHL